MGIVFYGDSVLPKRRRISGLRPLRGLPAQPGKRLFPAARFPNPSPKENAMNYALSAVIGYLIGTVNPAFIIAKLHGFDIREKGSKNAGASNIIITLGKARGFLCAAFDIAKAALAVLLTGWIFTGTDTFAVTAAAVILGHIFPFYMGFRGGKGLACLGGAILAYDLRVFGIMFTAELLILLVTQYICFVPITAAVAFPFVYGFMRHDIWGALLLGAVAVVIFWKHRINIRRVIQGSEIRISYLWNRDKEVKRLKKFYPDEENT